MAKDIISIVENSKVIHPIATAATTGHQYWIDFLLVTEDYKKTLTKQDYDKFLIKSQLDYEISNAQYLQFASEVTVVDYIIGGRAINIEVKCPNITKRMEQENSEGIKEYAAERFPNKDDYEQSKKFTKSNIKECHCIQTIDRMDNKLKDYLISAHQKFPVSNSSNFNILVIAVNIIPDMDE